MRPSNNLLRGLALTGTLVLLAACSEYFDRRDAISFNAGDAIASDQVTMMVDPWPRVSADKNIRFNGERMQERDRPLPHEQGDRPEGRRHVRCL